MTKVIDKVKSIEIDFEYDFDLFKNHDSVFVDIDKIIHILESEDGVLVGKDEVQYWKTMCDLQAENGIEIDVYSLKEWLKGLLDGD